MSKRTWILVVLSGGLVHTTLASVARAGAEAADFLVIGDGMVGPRRRPPTKGIEELVWRGNATVLRKDAAAGVAAGFRGPDAAHAGETALDSPPRQRSWADVCLSVTQHEAASWRFTRECAGHRS